jgi:hypothetical protein
MNQFNNSGRALPRIDQLQAQGPSQTRYFLAGKENYSHDLMARYSRLSQHPCVLEYSISPT